MRPERRRTNIFWAANAGFAVSIGWHYGTEVFFVSEKMLAVSRSEAISTFVLGALLFVVMNGILGTIIDWCSKLDDER